MADHAELQSVHILIAAQRQADQVVADARALAAQVAGDTDVQRAEMLSEARIAASRIRQQADQEADSVRAQAAVNAERLLDEMKAKAPLEAQARFTYFTVMGDAIHAQLRAMLAGLEEAIASYEARADQPPNQPPYS